MLPGFFPATTMPDPDWWAALWPDPGTVLAAIGVPTGGRAVDLCCGDGMFIAPLARVAACVIAIDLDAKLLGSAEAKVATSGVTNCEFIEGDAYDIATLVSQPVDFVLMANTFHGVPDKQRLARAVASVVEPGGAFVIVNWHRRPREETVILGQARGPRTEMRMTPEDLALVIEPAGFHAARTVELPPYHYGSVFERRTR